MSNFDASGLEFRISSDGCRSGIVFGCSESDKIGLQRRLEFDVGVVR